MNGEHGLTPVTKKLWENRGPIEFPYGIIHWPEKMADAEKRIVHFRSLKK